MGALQPGLVLSRSAQYIDGVAAGAVSVLQGNYFLARQLYRRFGDPSQRQAVMIENYLFFRSVLGAGGNGSGSDFNLGKFILSRSPRDVGRLVGRALLLRPALKTGAAIGDGLNAIEQSSDITSIIESVLYGGDL